MSTIGERIAMLRNRRGMTQSQLGEAIGETKQTIYKYERGIVTNIPLPKVEALAKALRCPPVALTGWEDGSEESQPPANDTPAQEEIPEEIRMIARAGQKMSPERRQDMLRMLMMVYPEEFKDDDA